MVGKAVVHFMPTELLIRAFEGLRGPDGETLLVAQRMDRFLRVHSPTMETWQKAGLHAEQCTKEEPSTTKNREGKGLRRSSKSGFYPTAASLK